MGRVPGTMLVELFSYYDYYHTRLFQKCSCYEHLIFIWDSQWTAAITSRRLERIMTRC